MSDISVSERYMASASPADSGIGSGGDGSGQHSGYGSAESSSSRSPLHMNLGFLKSLTEKRTTRDGQTPKRRGPKPDSKPALTRRQELNRQAQRTHRERKEQYIKALEQEVLSLKEALAESIREKERALDENRRLKTILAEHGIPYPGQLSQPRSFAGLNQSQGSASLPMAYGSTQNYNIPQPDPLYTGAVMTPPQDDSYRAIAPPGQVPQQGLDYGQLGIDFVLTLERPCMDHTAALMAAAEASPPDDPLISGHVLMVSAPPPQHLLERSSEPYILDPPSAQKPGDVGRPELSALMDLSKRLNLDGEITPVMAWAMILSHDRVAELTAKDIATVRDELKGKVRCYGFGAVLEEFEVRDALSAVFATKIESYQVFS